MTGLGNSVDAITVVIPTLNEALTVTDIINRSRPYSSDILVVDGHSFDDTAAVAKSLGARVIFDHKKGKGEAIRTAHNPSSAEGDTH